MVGDKADLGPHFGEAACILTIRNCSMEVRVKRVLITGMSGTGKSSVIHQLAAQCFEAVDLDSDEFSHWVEVLPGTSRYAPNRGVDADGRGARGRWADSSGNDHRKASTELRSSHSGS